jgi:hypothetical protein
MSPSTSSQPLIHTQAVTPLVVYAVGCVLGTESASWRMLVNLAVVVLGAVIAAAGRQ